MPLFSMTVISIFLHFCFVPLGVNIRAAALAQLSFFFFLVISGLHLVE